MRTPSHQTNPSCGFGSRNPGHPWRSYRLFVDIVQGPGYVDSVAHCERGPWSGSLKRWVGNGYVRSGIPLHHSLLFYYCLCFAVSLSPLSQKTYTGKRLTVWPVCLVRDESDCAAKDEITHPPFQWSSALIATALLMFFIGLPVAYITDAYYKGQTLTEGERQ